MQTTINDQTTCYPFLARPPPSQKRKPAQAPPSPPIAVTIPPSPSLRRRASAISAWAALVQPGSPAPCSPHRHPSNASSRRPSFSRPSRRSSISHSRAPSGSLPGLIHNPTSAQDIDVSLSGLGYTSVFVHIPPKTPPTPSHLARSANKTPIASAIQPPSPKKSSSTSRTIKRFRSLGILRPRSKSTTSRAVPLPSPTKTTAMGTRARAELIAKRKKAKYPHVPLPPPLANEIALMQFADGGSVESNVRRMMEARAKAAGDGLGVPDVYRDGKGGIWLDQDEEMEYAHLLGGDVDGEHSEVQWIRFDDKRDEGDASRETGIVNLVGTKRESLSTQDSDLSSRYIVLPAEETQWGPEDAILSFAIPPKSPFRKHLPASTPGLSVLSLPSRPRRAAKHLRKPEYLTDIAAFGPRSPGMKIRSTHGSPLSPHSSSSSSPTSTPRPSTPVPTPKSARFSSVFVLAPAHSSGKGKRTKRKPAPLELDAARSAAWKKVEILRTPLSASKTMSMSTSSVGVLEEARREFVQASFAPQPIVHRIPTQASKDFIPPSLSLQRPQPRGKVVIASLDPSDDMAKCREWAGMTIGDFDGDVDMCVSRTSGSVARKKRLGLGGLFGRK
ncbi:hypothetical protein AN958_03950 [Leucoagaricus sp. SymC.cos]|nr:hypothetical protein AN958_03950 [Leucoagaricus sp. SymC.cos]